MRYDSTMVDRQVGRNAELFAQSVAWLDARESRYPYPRLLLSPTDQTPAEWRQRPHALPRIAALAPQPSAPQLDT